jgi:hypothetical protein
MLPLGLPEKESRMVRILHKPFSTLRVLVVPPEADPSSEPLLRHAGVLIESGRVVPVWDGVSGKSDSVRRFLTSTRNDFTAPELRDLARIMIGLTRSENLGEASLARISSVRKEAFQLLQEDRSTWNERDRLVDLEPD